MKLGYVHVVKSRSNQSNFSCFLADHFSMSTCKLDIISSVCELTNTQQIVFQPINQSYIFNDDISNFNLSISQCSSCVAISIGNYWPAFSSKSDSRELFLVMCPEHPLSKTRMFFLFPCNQLKQSIRIFKDPHLLDPLDMLNVNLRCSRSL